jgi:hypothetical protein
MEKVDTMGHLSSREVTGEAIPVGEALRTPVRDIPVGIVIRLS